MPTAGLSDTQKADLYKIWATHSKEALSDSTSGDDNAMTLDDRSSQFTATLTSFFIHVLNIVNNPPRLGSPSDGAGTGAGRANGQVLEQAKQTSLFDTFKPFFPSLQIADRNNSNSNSAVTVSAPSSSDNSAPLTPRLSQGRHLVTIDHTSFLSELEAYERNQNSNGQGPNNAFGAFLYHKPNYGLCITNCAIALTLITLQRRARAAMTHNHQSSGHHHHQHHHHHLMDQTRNNAMMVPPQSILINLRFQNVYPLIEIQDVKTSNAYKLITLRGRIIKVHPKRLRLLNADVLCIKCGEQFEHMFQGGRYELPKRCVGGLGDNGKKCQGQKFELLRRTAKYIDCQILKLQEDDNATSAAGRTPRHIEVEVTHDLVNVCHAGDCVRVVGVINAVNSAVASGRGGKRAAETSTYHLFMKANSIVNTTAELHDRKKKPGVQHNDDGGGSNRGLAFTDDQLEKITKVAHADHMFGTLPIRMAFPFDLLVRSLCPSIIGHDMVKAGILLGLLGGTPPSSSGLEDVRSGVSIRSNIHCLIVGDPGKDFFWRLMIH